MERKGKIAKGIAGFYYVYDDFKTLFECRARGGFRNEGVKPLVGDDVLFCITDEARKTGTIQKILPRKNEVLRPALANLDQVLIVFAAAKPAPAFELLDRFLIRMQLERIPVLIGFSKGDLISGDAAGRFENIYRPAGYPVFFFSVKENQGLEALGEAFAGKTTALAGPSGVGKSTLINHFCPDARMETGEISRKIERGRHTTRHSELFSMDKDSFLMDTPGFSTLYLNEIQAAELWKYYPEMGNEEKRCRFTGCSHMEEPDCGVKAAVLQGRLAKERYESYRAVFWELSGRKRY